MNGFFVKKETKQLPHPPQTICRQIGLFKKIAKIGCQLVFFFFCANSLHKMKKNKLHTHTHTHTHTRIFLWFLGIFSPFLEIKIIKLARFSPRHFVRHHSNATALPRTVTILMLVNAGVLTSGPTWGFEQRKNLVPISPSFSFLFGVLGVRNFAKMRKLIFLREYSFKYSLFEGKKDLFNFFIIK